MLDDYHLCSDCPLEGGGSTSVEGSVDGGPDGSGGTADGAADHDGGTDGPSEARDGSSASDQGGDSGDGGLPIDAADGAAEGGDAASEAGDASAPDASDAGTLDLGLLVYYRFDETGGTTAADGSGNGHTASLAGGATFSSGVRGNAVTLSGASQYVSLPSGILGGATSFSVAAWVKLSSSPTWCRIFDFGTGTTVYMFLTPNSASATTRFGITTAGNQQEQQVNTTPTLPTGTWQHVAITLSGSTATLYVQGASVAQNSNMTLTPASLGSTTQNWIGRSQFSPDPYLHGQVDNFRIYSRALGASEVQGLYASQL
jgi:hypothetical protein